MKRMLLPSILFACTLPQAVAGGGAHYVGGTHNELRVGSAGNIQTLDAAEMRFTAKTITVRVPYESITNLEYGQKVSRRYVEAVLISPLLLLAKKRSHFLTIGYIDEQGKQQAIVFRLGQGEVRAVLAGLEARTGRKVEYQDDEARKAGKG